MHRNTPLFALFLAPLVISLLLTGWRHIAYPLWVSYRHDETTILRRLGSDDAQTRSRALRDAMSVDPADAGLVRRMLEILQTDDSFDVRRDAGQSLGQVGQRAALPADVMQALTGIVLDAPADGVSAIAISAIGLAAARNPVSDAVIRHLIATLDAPHAPWLQQAAITALGQIGAAQGLPEDVLAVLHAHYRTEARRGEREDIGNALEVYAHGHPLTPDTTALLIATLAGDERNRRIRVKAIYALAHGATDSAALRTALEAAQQDNTREVGEAARHGLFILDTRALYANRTPAEAALDRSLPVEKRLQAIGRLRENSDDPVRRRQVVELSRDPDTRIVIAALELFKYVDGSPGDAFERDSFIPALRDGLTHPDAGVRAAAQGALAMILTYNPAYRRLPDPLRTAVEQGARDAVGRVRHIALANLLRTERDDAARMALLDQALNDTDPEVRAGVARWTTINWLSGSERRYVLQRLAQDEQVEVRTATDSAVAQRHGGWWYELKRLWRAGEYGKLGFKVLTYITIAAPILVGNLFLVYFVARLLTYIFRRSWRSLAVLPVVAAWAAASYGMFLLYFTAGLGNPVASGDKLLLAAFLWLAVAVYAALGWGLHFIIRK